MSEIEKLINKLCPDGVEYRPIWSLTAWDKKFNGVEKEKQQKIISYKYYLSSDFEKVERKNGNIKYISTGISKEERYTTEELAREYLAEGEIVCIPWGGTPNVKYYKGRFVTGDNRIATSLDTKILNNKFLYYWMESKLDIISSFYRGSGIKHPSMKSVLDMTIAVPPLEVQKEIVHILDNFTELTAEITAELTARKKQYEYYRDELITKNYEKIVKLSDLCIIKGRIGFRGYTRNDLVEKGNGAISLSPGNIVNGTINYNNCTYISWKKYEESPEIMINNGDVIFCKTGSTLGKVAMVENLPEKATLNPQLVVLRDIKCNPVYLKYILGGYYFQSAVQSKKGLGSVPNISQKDIGDIEIKLHNIDNQNRIANILSNLDKICNSFSNGLPAEIEARQKQYEYYRDKLLTFKELDVNE